jgi:hypothetical protein
MEDIIGILHKDGKRSHYISLDEYFTKEKQSYFYDYFNSQEEEYNFMNSGPGEHLGVNLDGKGIQESEQVQYIGQWLDFIQDSKFLKEVELFQVIKNFPVEQHRDGDETVYEHVSDGMISPDGDFFTTNLWRFYYWFWFRLSDDKKMFFGKNKDIEFKGRGMIYNGMDYHGSPDMGGNTTQWSILMKGLPTEQLSKKFSVQI